jgi:hypothetical protein
VLIAPYNDVTASGTAMLAYSFGLPVVAFADPGWDGLIPGSNTVPMADVEALSHLAAQFCARGEGGNWTEVAESMDASSINGWTAALRTAMDDRG